MNCVKHWFVVPALLISATACMDALDNEAASPGEQQISRDDSPPLVHQWNVAVGKAPLDNGSGDVAINVDCAFIDWCNRPSSISPDIGTVCRVRTGCAFPPSSATVTECTNDALAVCGAIVQPAFICKQGAACP